MPKVVEAEGPRDTRSFEYCFPGFLDVADWKAGLFAFKVAEDEHVLPGLLMHGFQDRSRRLGHRYRDGLLALCPGDPDDSCGKIALLPTQAQNVPLAKASIGGQLDDGTNIPALVIGRLQHRDVLIGGQVSNDLVVGLEKLDSLHGILAPDHLLRYRPVKHRSQYLKLPIYGGLLDVLRVGSLYSLDPLGRDLVEGGLSAKLPLPELEPDR